MPPRRAATKRAQVIDEEVEDTPGSGQSPQSLAADLAAQPELLAAATELLKQRQNGSDSLAGSAKKKAKTKGKALLSELMGTLTAADASDPSKTDGSGEKKKKACKAWIQLAKHMQGPKRGQLSGKAFYAILCAFEENEALYKHVERIFHQKPRWQKDFGAHVVDCSSDKLALILHRSIINAKHELPKTASSLNTVAPQGFEQTMEVCSAQMDQRRVPNSTGA